MSAEIKFWDHSKRLDWFYARAVTRKVLARPEVRDEIWAGIEERWLNDPTKYRSTRLWRGLLTLPPEEFARTLLSDTPDAFEARENFAPYFGLTSVERAAVISASHNEAALT